MKKLRFGLFGFVAATTTAVLAAAEHRVNLDSIPEVTRVAIVGVSGDIIVEGVDEPVIVIASEREDEESASSPEPELREGLRSLLTNGSDNTGMGLQASAEGETYSIVSVRPNDDIDLHVRMLRSLALKIAGVVDGDVAVSGLRAEVNIEVVDGDIEVEDVSGPLVVHTVDGDINVRFASFAAETPSSLQSVDGDITVHLPADAAASLELRTVDGDIYTDLPVEVTQRKTAPHQGPSTVQAELNGGGPLLKLFTVDGDVVVRAAE